MRAGTPCSDLEFPLGLAWISSKTAALSRDVDAGKGRAYAVYPMVRGQPWIAEWPPGQDAEARMRGADVQFVFEDYVLDLGPAGAHAGSELSPIGPQVFDLLLYLVQNRERVVSKDDLLERSGAGESSRNRP